MTTLRIGLMLLRGGGRRGFMRLGLIVMGTAIGVWALLLAIALPQVLQARQQRAEDRIPRGGARADSDVRFQVATKRIGERALPVVYLAGSGAAPAPPGVDALPGPGDAVVSPGLARSLTEMPDLEAVFPFEVVEQIDPAGLVSPEEWYAYVGVSGKDLSPGSSRLAAFGSDLNPEVDISAGDVRFVNFALLGLVGLPLLVYFGVSASLSAATRLRRLAALRLLGMSARQARRVNAIETSVAAWFGSAVGLVAYGVIYQMLASSGLGGMVWFPADGAPGPTMVFIALFLVPSFAAVVSTIGSRRGVHDALATRRSSPVRKARFWRLLPLFAGLGILVGLIVSSEGETGGGGDTGGMFLLAGLLLTAVGLTWGFEVVIVSAARWLAGRSSSTPVLLGARRLEFDPGAAIRVIAGLVLVVVGLGFANGLQRDAQASSLPVGPTQFYQVESLLHKPSG